MNTSHTSLLSTPCSVPIVKHLTASGVRMHQVRMLVIIRFQRKLIQLDDAATISGTQSEHHIISSVTEQVKQSKKGLLSEFKQQLKIQMHARQIESFSSWAERCTIAARSLQL